MRNTGNNKNIHQINAGLWSHNCKLEISNKESDKWCLQVEETISESGIQAISIPSIMSNFNSTKIDVLKMDIEGSEIEVMRESSNWIHLVNFIFIELHDRFRPGCRDSVEYAIRNLKFDRTASGEKLIFKNLS